MENQEKIKSNFFKNIKDSFSYFSRISDSDLSAWRNGLFFLMIADIFGVWWYLQWKSLAYALLIVLVVVLAMILIEESRRGNESEGDLPKIDDDGKEEKKKGKKKETSKPRLKNKPFEPVMPKLSMPKLPKPELPEARIDFQFERPKIGIEF